MIGYWCYKFGIEDEDLCLVDYVAVEETKTNELPGLTLEDVISLAGENHDALIKMMVFHCRGGVEYCQGRVHLQHQTSKLS